MNKNITLPIVLILLIFKCNSSNAQDSTVVQDFEMWTGVTVKKSFLDKKLQLGLTQEFRLNDNSTRMNNFFTELEGKYKIYKGLSVGAAYRFIRNNTKSGYINENRFNLDLGYKYKFDRLSLAARFRYQNKNELGVSKDEGDFPISKFRFRLKGEYNIKNWKLDPYLSAEVFFAQQTYRINYIESIIEPTQVSSGLEKLRFTIGTSYKINKLISIGGFYRVEQELKSYPLFYNTPGRYFIGGLNLTFKL